MISKEVIMATLIGIAVTGVIPFIGGIVLLAMGKIKGSSFWAGVLAYFIAVIVSSILSVLIVFASPDLAQNETMLGTIGSVITAVSMILAMGVCEGASMKNRTFNGAVSCGFGFGIGYAMTAAISLISLYVMFGMINSGQFDAQYAPMIQQGMLTKEGLQELKSQFTGFTFSECVLQIMGTIAFSMVFVACAVFIMCGKCTKNFFVGLLASAIVASADALAMLIPNTAAAVIVPLAISAAALVFAVRMKDKVAEERVPAMQDSFMASIEKAQNDNDPFNM